MAEHLTQQIGDPRRGVGADLLFLVTDHVEEAVEGSADDVAIEVEGLQAQEGNALGAAEEVLVLPGDADLPHRAVHDGRERGGQLARRLVLEVVGGRRLGAVQDPAAVVDGHLADRVPEDLLGRRRRALGGAVHLQDQVVHLAVVADGAQPALERLELLRHEDLDRLVLEVAVGASRQLDRVLDADLERLLERLADLHVAERAALGERQLGAAGQRGQLLEQLVELGGGAHRDERNGEHGQERSARRAHRSSWGAPIWPPTPPSARTRPGPAVARLGLDTGCLIDRRGGPRYGPPHPPALGRAPAQPWRASALTQDVSSIVVGGPDMAPQPLQAKGAMPPPRTPPAIARTRPGTAVARLGLDTGCLIALSGWAARRAARRAPRAR